VAPRIRASILTTLTARLGFRGEALTIARDAFASSDDVRRATGLLGLVLTVFVATSFTTALQRAYMRAWRRPPHGGRGAYWRGLAWLGALLACMALLGALRGALGGGPGVGLFFGVALPLVTWFSGAAICVLVGACVGPVLAEDSGQIGTLVRGGDPSALTADAPPSLHPPTRELSLRDAFQRRDEQ
jgi:hypothetical protein